MKIIIYLGLGLAALTTYSTVSYFIFRNKVKIQKKLHVPNTVNKVSMFPFSTEIYTRTATNTTEEDKTVFMGLF